MILLAHMLFGAAIGSFVKNPLLAIILAFFGHYFLDLFPHVEYSVEKLKAKIWDQAIPDMIKVALDIALAFLAIFLFSNNEPLIYICAIVALIPDCLTMASLIWPNPILAKHDYVHTNKVHFLKHKKISNFWRISTQAITIATSVVILSL